MAVDTDLPLTFGRNMPSLTYTSDIVDRASRIAPIAAALGGQRTVLGYARWRVASPNSGAKTIVNEDPAGGAGLVGFANQCVGWYVLLEHTGESFRITASDPDTQTLTLETWSASLVAGELFQLRLTAPGTTYSAFTYRQSVASVLPPPPGIPIQDAEVTAVAGSTLTVRDGWLYTGVGPITVDGQHVGRSVRLSELVAVDAITDFSAVGGQYVYSFADVSAYQVGDWMRRAAETDGGFSHGDINTFITSAFPAAMTIVAVDTGANTVTVVSRDGGSSLNRAIFDTAVYGSDHNQIRIYRPDATLRTVTGSSASAKTLTLDDVSGFSIAGGDGAVEILIASTVTSGKVPWYLDHPLYVQEAPTGIGVRLRTIDRSEWLGVQNLVPNGVMREWTTATSLPDGYLGAASLGQAGTATPSNFIIAQNTDPLFTRLGGKSLFFSTTAGVLYAPPILWTPQYVGQRVSVRVSLILTKWDGNSALITLQLGIKQANGTVLPWYEQPRSTLIQPASSTAPRPDPPFRKFAANVWDDVRLVDFDITEPSAYPSNLRPNSGDIAAMGAGIGLVASLTINGGGTTVEGYWDGIAIVTAREAPDDVKEFYDANRLHQDTNVQLREYGPPQFTIAVDFFDAKRMNPALDEPDAAKGVVALVNEPSSGIVNVRRRITDVSPRNMNVPGETRIILGKKKQRLASAVAPAPGTKPPATTSGGVTNGTGATGPSIALDGAISATGVASATATVTNAVRVKFAASLLGEPSIDDVRAGISDVTPPFAFTGPSLGLDDIWYVAALAYDTNGTESGLARTTVALSLAAAWLRVRAGVGFFADSGKTVVASNGDNLAVWEDQSGNGRDVTGGGVFRAEPVVALSGTVARCDDTAAHSLTVPFMGAIAEGELIITLKRIAAPVSDTNGSPIYQLGAQGNGDTHFPRESDGHWWETFGTAHAGGYDCGVVPPGIAAGEDGGDNLFHTIRVQSTTRAWRAWLDGVLVKEVLTGLQPDFSQTAPVLGNNALGHHGNVYIAAFTIFEGELTDAQAATETGLQLADATGTTAQPPAQNEAVMILKGSLDCSGDPDYPAADAGHVYEVSVAGRIGGASGAIVAPGDTLYCLTDGTASGDQATVGDQWVILHANPVATAESGVWEPLTNGDADAPELIFADGDVVMAFTP